MKRLIEITGIALVVTALNLAILVGVAAVVVQAGPVTTQSAGDANGDGSVELVDVIYLLAFLFQDGPEPVAIAQNPVGTPTPVGSVVAFAGPTSNVPPGWLLCDGAQLSSLDYPELFDAIGVSHGGSTTGPATRFHLPDYRGRFLRGVNNGATETIEIVDDNVPAGSTEVVGIDPDASERSAPRVGGNSGDAVGSVQEDQVVRHSHSIDFVTVGFQNAGPPFPSLTGAPSPGLLLFTAGTFNPGTDTTVDVAGYLSTPPADEPSPNFLFQQVGIRRSGTMALDPGNFFPSLDGSQLESPRTSTRIRNVRGESDTAETAFGASTVDVSSWNLETRPKNSGVHYLIKALP